MLLVDTSQPLALPSRAGANPGDDPTVRARMASIAERHTRAIVESVSELDELGLVKGATAEVRVHSASPMFKSYLINGHEVFFGFYPVIEHETPSIPDPNAKSTKTASTMQA